MKGFTMNAEEQQGTTPKPNRVDAADALTELTGASFLIGCVAESQSFSEDQWAGLVIIERAIARANGILSAYLKA